MDKNKFTDYLFGIMMSINSKYNMFNGLSFDEMLIATNERIMNITLGLSFEIRELIDNGYSEEQILNMIQNIVFDSEDNISDREAEYIKKDARKTLKLIIDN